MPGSEEFRNPGMTTTPLRLSEKLAYGAGDLGPAVTANIQIFFTLLFLTNVAGLDAGLAGVILLITKVWDAINDPLIGVLSDRTKSRWGRRLPWIVLGALPFGIFFFLGWLVPNFSPDPQTNQWALFAYYVVIALIFNTFYTVVNLPYTALTPELTQDYNERTNLNSFRFAFSIGGSIASLIAAGVIFSQVRDPIQQYVLLGAIGAIGSVIPLWICAWGIKGRAMQSNNARIPETKPLPLKDQIPIVLSNQPFLYVIGIYLCSWLAVQVTASVLPYFVINWMGLSSSDFTLVAIAVQGTALGMLFVWSALSKLLGKKVVYYLGGIVWIMAQAGLFFLQPGQITLMYILAVMAGVGVSVAYLIPWSMLPDVIELYELRTGQRHEGIFYSFMVLLQKIALALGLFLVGQALNAAGFIESTAAQATPVQPESALLAIRIALGPLPTVALIGGLILAYFYPITQQKHQEVLDQLAQKRGLGARTP